MGTNGDVPNLAEGIDLSDEEMAARPVFAASGSNLFIAFMENEQIFLRYSQDAGASLSAPQELMTLEGNGGFLRINAKDNVAVIVVVEDIDGGLSVKGVTGRLVDGNFNTQECPNRPLQQGITFNDILDVAIRINNDTSSDDFVFVKKTGGATVTATGHHPRAP